MIDKICDLLILITVCGLLIAACLGGYFVLTEIWSSKYFTTMVRIGFTSMAVAFISAVLAVALLVIEELSE